MSAIHPPLTIEPQPTDDTCGPTCLHAVYSYYDDVIDLGQVIREVKQLKTGGTLAVMLGNHALKRGYQATIYTYNLQVFDPSWFQGGVDLAAKLKAQQEQKGSRKLKAATQAYLTFLARGGQLQFEELTSDLLKRFLQRDVPILTGLSATYLYQSAREIPETNAYDDVRGYPAGHFVVLSGYQDEGTVWVADPLKTNPIEYNNQYYSVSVERAINAILLGIVTFDANLLVIHPKP